MKNKNKIIIILAIFIILVILILWVSGIIPKQIAKTYGSYYLKKNFPEIQLEFSNIEWSSAFGDYSIQFKDEEENTYGFLIGPKYFPINFGQGIYGFEEKYREKFGNKNNNEEVKNKKYIELENLELDYDFAQMVEDRCYILTNSNAVYHIEELDNFIKNVENKKADEIRIIEYTIEGEPIITNLEYTVDKFILKNDWRRDSWSVSEDRKIVTTEYDASKYMLVKSETSSEITKLKTYYELSLQALDSNETVYICMYAEVKQDENQKFEIQFNKDLKGEEITKILGKEETDKYDYDIYSYKGTANIIINGEKMSLREALLNNKITVEEILEKAKKDAKEDMTIFGDVYLDGGSTVYIYNDYSILKLNTLSMGENYGKKDLYIGVPSMDINDILATYNS